MQGIIKFYQPEKGWGFITGEDRKDYFFHRKNFVQPRPNEDEIIADTNVTFTENVSEHNGNDKISAVDIGLV